MPRLPKGLLSVLLTLITPILFFLIGRKLLYNVVLVSAIQQHKSVIIIYIYIFSFLDFPGGSDGKASVYNVRDLGSIPGLGRFPGEGNGNPLQYFLP